MGAVTTSKGSTRDDRRGCCFGRGNWPVLEQPASPSESDIDPEQALTFWEDQIQILEQQRHETNQRIRRLEEGRNNYRGQMCR